MDREVNAMGAKMFQPAIMAVYQSACWCDNWRVDGKFSTVEPSCICYPVLLLLPNVIFLFFLFFLIIIFFWTGSQQEIDPFVQTNDMTHDFLRYNELLFIIDTCQGASMYERFYSPNIMALASSQVGEDSLSVSTLQFQRSYVRLWNWSGLERPNLTGCTSDYLDVS